MPGVQIRLVRCTLLVLLVKSPQGYRWTKAPASYHVIFSTQRSGFIIAFTERVGESSTEY